MIKPLGLAVLFLTTALGATLLAEEQPVKHYERAKGIELAHPGTLQEYMDRYTGEDVGCTIGGQTFRNFKIRIQHSVDDSKLDGRPHPQPPMTPDQIFLTPVNYIKDGHRWVGFRYTNGPDGWTILGGDKSPPDYPYKKGHDIKNAGFTTKYDIRFEVHGTSPWQRGKVAYTGLKTDCFVDGQWSEAKNTGPGSRGNLGWYPRKIGVYGGVPATNPKTPQSGSWARLSSISHAFNPDAKAPLSNDNWIYFSQDKPTKDFEIRAGMWPDYNDTAHLPHLYSYGMWFRMNCWGKINTRWHADYIEWAWSNDSITDDVWTADGTNKAAPPAPLPTPKEPLPTEPLAVATPSGKTLSLDCGRDIALKLVEIPAGKFIMGSPDNEAGRCDNEGPQRVVTISKPFYMGVYEVTQQQWQALLGEPDAELKTTPDPVDNLKQASAVKFCHALSKKSGRKVRLPTEAEWEYAARAGSATPFSFGADSKQADDYAWTLANTTGRSPHPVGQKKPNAWGLFDMHGNVWEWTSDLYTSNYVDAGVTDPHSTTGECPTLRGGSWAYPTEYSRSAIRLIGSPNDIADGHSVGFRVVVEQE